MILPQGPVQLLAAVTLVGFSETAQELNARTFAPSSDRWLELQLLGEIDAFGVFQRGVSSYPGLDDPVHFPHSEILAAVHPKPDKNHVQVGYLAASPTTPVSLDLQRLVSRHSVVVGSTGSGKTSAVSTILQQIARGEWPAANVVVIDPHGEYAEALADVSSVLSVAGDENGSLQVPYWALPADDILNVLTGTVASNATLTNRFSELVSNGRRKYAEVCGWLANAEDVNADTPIPFDLHDVWHQLDYDNSLVVARKPDGDPKVLVEGDPQSLTPTQFEPYGPGGAAPFQGPLYNRFLSAPSHIRARMKDPRFDFFLKPNASVTDHDPFEDVLSDWLGGEQPISVLDFSGVPTEAADVAIGVVLQLLFELCLRSTAEQGVGRHRPVLIVIEEAHRFLGDNLTARLARESANRIAREGRKYGVGMMLVSQRPSELPDTAFSQAGTVISLRLTNAADQARLKSGLPDAISGLADSLPALRTGEAIVSGEAISLPSRVRIEVPNPPPRAADPKLHGWRDKAQKNDVSVALAEWRGITNTIEREL
ncbi:ATP-binding protein [Paenarthrobacter nitroguajacolicus]|uniref:ATP-binding protein n=1 Tax=Paenarthrobacter nitroguajacolicus TaxID=211146 RepID=UPI001C4BADE7|nr:ATP-binding protein [Paenarthrobacter nitroguajacolicus]